MKPAEYIDFAQRLAIQPTLTPAMLRSITSRAYYGAFHLAKEFIGNLGQPTTVRHDAHVWLMDSQSQAAHEAGKLLADLNSARIKADYQLTYFEAETVNFARRSVERAVEVQKLLQQCSALPVPEVMARRRGIGR